MSDGGWRERMELRQRNRRAIRHRWQQIAGLIVALWGGGILVYSLSQGGPRGEGAYYIGQLTGWMLAVILFCVGLHYMFRKPAEPPPKVSPEHRDQRELMAIVRARYVGPRWSTLFFTNLTRPWAFLVLLGFLLGGFGACQIYLERGGWRAMVLTGIAILLSCAGLGLKKALKQ